MNWVSNCKSSLLIIKAKYHRLVNKYKNEKTGFSKKVYTIMDRVVKNVIHFIQL